VSASAEPSRAQRLFGDFAPKLVQLNDDVLFGDVWERPGLAKRDRSLITVATLVALNRTDQLEGHLQRAIDNGVTLDELIELITHVAFYAGWPNAMTAIIMAKRLFGEPSAEVVDGG
jgi:4-carboxymuconolactone decarboxylase